MDKRLVGVSTTDEIGSHVLVHLRESFRKLFMVPSYGGNGDNYGYDCRNKAQEALFVTHNSVLAVGETLAEEGVEKIR